MIKNAEKTFRILADTNRIRILKLLERRKMCVCELAFVLQVTQPSISRHIKKMKEIGLVADEQDGFWTNYYMVKSSKYVKEAMQCLNRWVEGDKLIKSDLERFKKADRTKLCCK